MYSYRAQYTFSFKVTHN